MKKLLFIPLILILGLAFCAQTQRSYKTEISVYFSPKGKCQEAIIKEINGAQKEILVQACFFTSKDILNALKTAGRKVTVDVIQDYRQYMAKPFILDELSKAGIATYIDDFHYQNSPRKLGSAHDKIMIIDQKILITGSFNFTDYAEEHNGENLLIIKDDLKLVERYTENYRKHKDHSKPYKYEK